MSTNSKQAPSPQTASEADGFIDVVDVAAVSVDNPQLAVRRVSTQKPDKTLKCDILIVGGGIGGVAAAAKIWRLTRDRANFADAPKLKEPISVILAEETDWLGGQMTAQGVPALDENYLVETSGATRMYQELRTGIREHYKTQTKLQSEATAFKYLNPGKCWVTRLAFEPKVALNEIDKLLLPAVNAGQLKILYRKKAFRVESNAAAVRKRESPLKIEHVYLVDLDNAETFSVNAKLVLDATELGDVLALSGLDYASGSDSRSQTGEPHAPIVGDLENVQDFTYPFVVELTKDGEHRIEQPAKFEDFQKAGKFSFLGYKMFVEAAKDLPEEGFYLPFWTYRRLIDAAIFDDHRYQGDLAVINWDSNDLRGQNLIDQPPKVLAERLALGKLLSLGFLYWMQNKVQRDEGGAGYPELLLRKDVLATLDGLSKYPYIRESRRIVALQTIVEQDIVASYHVGARSSSFKDSVGIGFYPVDIHGHQEISGAGQATKPFQLPLASLIPQAGGNLLPACKNIGVTHITNGAYRLHPIEWAIGESQGAIALICLSKGMAPQELATDPQAVKTVQRFLVDSGAPICWFDDVATSDSCFAAVQYLAAIGVIDFEHKHLAFFPNETATREQVACALVRLLEPLLQANDAGLKLKDVSSHRELILKAVANNLFALDQEGSFFPVQPFTVEEMRRISDLSIFHRKIRGDLQAFIESDVISSGPNISRGQLSRWLYLIAKDAGY